MFIHVVPFHPSEIAASIIKQLAVNNFMWGSLALLRGQNQSQSDFK